MSKRRRRLATRLRPADAPRRRTRAGGGLRAAIRRRRRWFKAPRQRRRRRPLAGAGGRLRQAVRPLRLRHRPSTGRPAPARRPRLPRIRPRRSVVDRVLPSGDPSPPRTAVRLRVLGLLVASLFSLMLIRLWYLQVLDSSAYSRTVTANQVRPVEVPAPRGLILDRTGATMVGDQVTEDITLSRVTAQQHPGVVAALAALVGVSTTQIEADLANPQYSLYKPVPVLENAPTPDVLYIGEHAAQFPGVSVVADTNRTYPMGNTGAQVLGYMGQIQKLQPGYQLGDLVGLSGLERQYQAPLRGAPGIDRVEVDAQGDVVGNLGETPPTPGQDLVTNVDAGLQQTLQQALDQEITSLHGASKGGAAVALDPQTGAVLALVSAPSYDPTWWTPNGITTVHYNQLLQSGALNDNAIQGLYTPGSTFKLATATAALETGLISPSYTFDDTGSYTIPGCASGGSGCATYHDNEGEAAGVINVSQAITVSSDIFFYNLGVQFWDYRVRYGQTPIQDVATNQYGYGAVSGIDLPDETNFARVDSPAVVKKEHEQYPRAYPNSGWFTGNNLEMAFGQGGTVITPIEQAVAYATFANGGTRYAPEIAAGFVDAKGDLKQRIMPKVTGHVSLSAAEYQAMLAGFEGVVQNPKGTAYGTFAGFPLGTFPLAGKTGTATTNEQQPNSWFVAWGPLPNPQYVIAVVIQGGGYGSSAAGPVVRQGFDYLVAHPEAPVRLAAPPATTSPCPGGAPVAGSGSTPSSTSTSTTTTGHGGTATTTSPCSPPGASASAAPRGRPRTVTSRSADRRSRPPPGRP